MSEFRPTEADYAKAQATFDVMAGLIDAGALSVDRTRLRHGLSVVLIGGFLGSGKTTLMRRLLTAEHGRLITAIVNDVAALNIDASLVASTNGDTLALSNGCVCCSASGGLARTLASIAARASRPDVVLVEATGLAYPAALAQVVEAVEGLHVDACVCVIDGDAWGQEEGRGRQTPMLDDADIVLLNKIDLVPRSSVEAVLREIEEMVPRACVVATADCSVPPELILSPIPREPSNHSPSCRLPEGGYYVWTYDVLEPVEQVAMEAILNVLPTSVLRVKGFIPAPDAPADQSWLLQAVGRRWRWETVGRETHALVLIGRSLRDGDALRSRLERAGLRYRSCVSA